jgi:dihydrofolate synthase/folylpolyglutamate synthase
MSSASLTQWLERLEGIHPREIELGLDRVREVAVRLDLLPVSPPVVTIAGTNGKGSTAAVLEALLCEAGHVTGTYTSPHFRRFNERIRVSGREVEDAEITAAFRTVDEARGGVSLTYFEFATLAALLVFRAREVDALVLEVGLGGRLDAVNVVDPSVAVITSIDLDHQEWLGETRDEIALEKAGIVRRGVPLVVADRNPPVSLLEAADTAGVEPLLLLGRDLLATSGDGVWQGELWSASGTPRELPPRPLGALLPQNIAAALQAAVLLGVELDEAQVDSALAAASPTGRLERRRLGGRNYLLDVAHNPAAVLKLGEHIDNSPSKGKTLALFSPMGDKDARGMVRAAGSRFEAWFLADQPANPRAAAAEDVARILREEGQGAISISKNVRQAFRRAQSVMVEGDQLVVFGSFHTVGAVLPLLDLDRWADGAGSAQ